MYMKISPPFLASDLYNYIFSINVFHSFSYEIDFL